MIFIIVGTQGPFDRLVKTVDEWASKNGRNDVFGQIGNTDYAPPHIKYEAFISPSEFNTTFEQADLIVSHAGMGTIISALEKQKPIIVMPRLTRLKEHRNDHQVVTAKSFLKLGYVQAAFDEKELVNKLDSIHKIRPADKISTHANTELINMVQNFIHNPGHRNPTIK